jgi:ABC-type nickel/cobalt efflux system permease component RcnA
MSVHKVGYFVDRHYLSAFFEKASAEIVQGLGVFFIWRHLEKSGILRAEEVR